MITVKGPALNFDRNNFLKLPKLIKKIRINKEKDYLNSLEKVLISSLKLYTKKNSQRR